MNKLESQKREEKEKRKRSQKSYKKEIINEINNIDVTGDTYYDKEYKKLKFLWENKDKIYRNSKLIKLLG